MSYPVLLHVEGRRVVVVGGGQVAARKVGDLLDAGARIAVISPALNDALMALVSTGTVNWHEEPYTPGRLRAWQPFLVIAAADSPSVNAQVIADAHDVGALVNRVDEVAGGDFTSMASFRRGPVTVAVATDGASPALATYLRQRLEALVGAEYGALAEWLAGLRPLVKQHLKSAEARRALWQAILDSSVLEHLRQGDETSARRVINHLLAEAGVEEAVR